ncbi:60S ribosomal protein L7a [Galemys pyrenaicus]|uniref:60S ribosomal protein L7a n=1 Tax=Galemys pyrenaicus TaxID=202257 RepID=A0A8J6DU20_GALPY|nr:60S ribosomal protein L7a [Galemys pyrenaicus]
MTTSETPWVYLLEAPPCPYRTATLALGAPRCASLLPCYGHRSSGFENTGLLLSRGLSYTLGPGRTVPLVQLPGVLAVVCLSPGTLDMSPQVQCPLSQKRWWRDWEREEPVECTSRPETECGHVSLPCSQVPIPSVCPPRGHCRQVDTGVDPNAQTSQWPGHHNPLKITDHPKVISAQEEEDQREGGPGSCHCEEARGQEDSKLPAGEKVQEFQHQKGHEGKRDLTHFVKQPCHTKLQLPRTILCKQLKVPPTMNQFTQALDPKQLLNFISGSTDTDQSPKQESSAGGGRTQHGRYELLVFLPAVWKVGDPYCVTKGKANLGVWSTRKLVPPSPSHRQRSPAELGEAVRTNDVDRNNERGGSILGPKSGAPTAKLEEADSGDFALTWAECMLLHLSYIKITNILLQPAVCCLLSHVRQSVEAAPWVSQLHTEEAQAPPSWHSTVFQAPNGSHKALQSHLQGQSSLLLSLLVASWAEALRRDIRGDLSQLHFPSSAAQVQRRAENHWRPGAGDREAEQEGIKSERKICCVHTIPSQDGNNSAISKV